MHNHNTSTADAIAANDTQPSLLQVMRLNHNDITRIMDIQSAIGNVLKGTTPEVFLKQRRDDDYAFMLDHGGAIFGVEHDGDLIGVACVNNAINKGRVEVKIDDTIDAHKIAVLQGTMTHPDVWGKPYRLADALYNARMNWIAEHDKTHAFTSVCCAATRMNPSNGERSEPIGNTRVINGLKRKGMIEKAVTSIYDRVENRDYHLNIMTLCYPLPQGDAAPYTKAGSIIQGTAQTWQTPTPPQPKFG